MDMCPRCKITVRGQKKCCPMCQGQLKHNADTKPDEAFPILKRTKLTGFNIIRMTTFLFLATEVLMLTSRYIFGDQPWMGIVMVGVFIAWLDVLFTMYFRNNFLKVVTFEVMAAIVIDYYVDKMTGFRGWSVSWMIPLSLAGLAVITVIIAKIMKLRLDEYIYYLIFDGCIALAGFYFIHTGANRYIAPACFTAAGYVILVIGVLIFRFKDIKTASQKMFNV